ncbi:valine--tRNA ligase, partial [bacterium]|nr:valine--tRNA ligase [bacterium]
MTETTLAKRYDPKKTESKWYDYWLGKEYFKADPTDKRPVFSIVIPPPNVTGELHIGHLLPMTLQDVMIRYKKMRGYNTLWLPGTDHASIATHTMVEKQLEKEGFKRKDISRDMFLERAWKWKEQYGSRIIHQLKRFGVACDWSRERFTMDEGLSGAVREVFVRLYEEGLIYRGTYLVNWCPRCMTAVSDLEVEHKETSGKLYYIKYPVKDTGKFITVATTRPETMLGDTAVAINPTDERNKWLLDETVILPILGRELKVISDPVVDPEFGTGIVKVTPAHDPNDYKLGMNHELDQINIFNHDGTMNENAGPYKGMDRFECRKILLNDLKNENLLETVVNHKLAIGQCQRCETIVEPIISEQWFVKIKTISDEAIRVVKEHQVRFIPEMWEKVYFEWMNNIRDWCISRQLWWGHRIPVWYCSDCGKETCTKEDPNRCKHCGSEKIKQDEDILDTWFSSALWPFSTMGWPDETLDLKTYYPTSILITAFDIIFFWVARMIMMGMKFMKEVPFKIVYFHGLICDETGAKMGRTKGNVIDPIEVVDLYGTDAVRFTLSIMAMPGRREIPLSVDRIEGYRNFANKIWNAARFVLMNIDNDFEFKAPNINDLDKIPFEGKWILSRIQYLIQKVGNAMDNLDFHIATDLIYRFLWHEYCDWYLEMAKLALYQNENSEI